ncbi:MAG: lipoate--protein ligase family protein [Campylobacterales bacterium]|nr:lipoate--protein ligase family protein [Campylobacterales bacterium]
MLKRWRLIDSGVGTAQYNMALDEALLRNFTKGSLPILRVYRWECSLSFGRFSDVRSSVDLKILQEKRLSHVRRMTGGGVLVHGGDFSYTLVLPRESLKDVGVKKSYKYLCGFLLELYKRLGLNAAFAHDLKLQSSKSNICMASYEPYDIIIDGKKMGGNAQRYTKDLLFQHGTIPITLNSEAFKDLFLEESGLGAAAALDKMQKAITPEQLTNMLLEAFKLFFDAVLFPDTINRSEKRSAYELLINKYSQEGWNRDAKHDEA